MPVGRRIASPKAMGLANRAVSENAQQAFEKNEAKYGQQGRDAQAG